MRLPHILILLFLSVVLFACDTKPGDIKNREISIIPKPQQMKLHDGSFKLIEKNSYYVHPDFHLAGDFLKIFFEDGSNFTLNELPENLATIRITKQDSLAPDAYVLQINHGIILIEAKNSAGAFYGVQTLRQLLPVAFETSDGYKESTITLPLLSIYDAPRFSYRGMHLDVGRHFFPKEFIKKYITAMALLKMNYFHWHLTEDQGWRIEIKKYPKLTTHAAYRNETLIGHYNETPQQFDAKRYGGFYTQEDIKEIVAFAAQHNITVIPEIEMPGHAQAAISAYPELGCTGEPVPVATKWGVFENIYCPNQKTFAFLKDVLNEVIDLFPGEYIHIGGDEAPKTQWKKCRHCQKLIADLNLKDEHGLQSYFIKEMEVFINGKGKKIIGWDEILEGGLAPNATVMSWRGTQGGIDAAKEHHDVIMTPTSHAYFDYYQADYPDEPLAIGGFLPLKKVYGFNPIPAELNDEEARYILGAQGNVWTEYMKTEDKVEYMVFPRIVAMSEVVWSGATKNLEMDYSNFLFRLEPFLSRLEALNINYANHLYEIEGAVVKKNKQVFFELTTPMPGKEIRYSNNGFEEKKYEDLILIDKNTTINATVFSNGEKAGRTYSETIQFHKGLLGKIELNVPPHKAYSAGGKEALINGIHGSDSRYGDKEWLGFWGDDVEVTINFEEEIEIDMVSLRFYNANGQWIYAPEQVSVKTKPISGKSVSSMRELLAEEGESHVKISLPFDGIKTKGLTISIPNYGTIPEGQQGAGNKAWTFIDEIVIE